MRTAGIAVVEFVEGLDQAFQEIAFGRIDGIVAVVEGQAAEQADGREIAASEIVVETGLARIEEKPRRQLLGKQVVEAGLRR